VLLIDYYIFDKLVNKFKYAICNIVIESNSGDIMTEIKISSVIEEIYHKKSGLAQSYRNFISRGLVVATGLSTSISGLIQNKQMVNYTFYAFLPFTSFVLGDYFGNTRFSKKEGEYYGVSDSRLHQVVVTLVDAGIVGSIASLVTGLATGNHAAVEGGQWGLLTLAPFRTGDISRVFDYRTKEGLAYTPEGLLGPAFDIMTRHSQP